MLLWPLLFMLFPALALIARLTAPAEALAASTAEIAVGVEGGMDESFTYPGGWLLWLGIAFTLGIFRCASMCYS